MLNKFFDGLFPQSRFSKVLSIFVDVIIYILGLCVAFYLIIAAFFFPILVKEYPDVYIPSEVSVKCAQDKECSNALKKMTDAQENLD